MLSKSPTQYEIHSIGQVFYALTALLPHMFSLFLLFHFVPTEKKSTTQSSDVQLGIHSLCRYVCVKSLSVVPLSISIPRPLNWLLY